MGDRRHPMAGERGRHRRRHHRAAWRRGSSSDPECSAAAGSSWLGGLFRRLVDGLPWSERAERTETRTFACPERPCLRIDNANGRTRVVGEDRDDIEVRIQKTARAESPEAAEALLDQIDLAARTGEEGLALEVEIPRRWNRRGSAHLDIRVPRGLGVELQASNGKVCIEGLRGRVRARASNGGVRVANVMGDVEILTSNAKVACSRVCGRVLAQSSNGKIELEAVRGSVDACTSNGLIFASLEAVGPEGVLLTTSNGRIVLELPEEVDADVDMRVDNGVIRSERRLEGARRSASAHRLRGVLGRGGTAIRLRTSNGSISLR